MARTPAQAVLAAKRTNSYSPSGMCQQFTRVCFAIGGGFGSARAAWQGAMKRHPVSRGSQVPAGVPVYWLGGSRGYGHAAVSLGNGLCRSTDWPRSRQVGTARIDDISRQWNMSLVGWTEDINGVKIPGIPGVKDGKPDIQLKHVIRASKSTERIHHGKFLKAAVAREVGKGKMNLASPVLGASFRTQYAEVQRKYLKTKRRKISQAATNGVPGRESLTWLGKRRGFDVV